ncbi:MAG: hypothetical protein NWE88_12760 [Candidatus Bathyarchaeota archaeon]|nr:hypothetical protein [Candidatus Bathyarchaeota archaeon]
MNVVSIRFDPQELANEMVLVFRTMDEAITEVIEFKENAVGIEQNKPSVVTKALKTLASMIATRNFYRTGTEGFINGINVWQKNHKSSPLSTPAKNELIAILDQHGMKWPGWSSSDRIRLLLEQLQEKTMKEWTKSLYSKVRSGEKKDEGKVIGIQKGADNFLRDFGYFDRIPIDIHEKRFILRTGIFHFCSSRDSDPLANKDFQNALVLFCRNYLSGIMMEDIDIGIAPGIVDDFIWNYCAKFKRNICGATPLCHECKLNTVCLFSIMRVSN